MYNAQFLITYKLLNSVVHTANCQLHVPVLFATGNHSLGIGIGPHNYAGRVIKIKVVLSITP